MKRFVISLISVLILAACNQGDDPAKVTAPDRFPGFTQLSPEGDKAKLYVELSTLKQQDQLVQFKLVKVLDNGYVIQEALTDCRGSLKTLEGMQYKADGKQDKPYPGIAQPIPVSSQPTLATLQQKVCQQAGMEITEPRVAVADSAEKPASATQALSEDAFDKMQTRAGWLEIGRSDFKTSPDSLFLDGRRIYQDEDTYLSLHRLFKLAGYEAVLFSSNCGGSGCPSNEFAFLILRSGAEPKVIRASNFDAYPQEVKTRQMGNSIKLDLGYFEGKRKLASLENEQLTIDLEDVPDQALQEDHCQWLHTDAMPACVEARKTTRTCNDVQAEFTGYLMRGVAAMLDYPGFNQSGFEQQCLQACKAGKLPDYASFGVAVCSKPATGKKPVSTAQDETADETTDTTADAQATKTDQSPSATQAANEDNALPFADKPLTKHTEKPASEDNALPFADKPLTKNTEKPTSEDNALPFADKPVKSAAVKTEGVMQGCAETADSADATLSCMKANLQTAKDRLNASYKTLFETLTLEQQADLEVKQRAWLEARNKQCGKLTETMAAETAIPMVKCIYKAVNSRTLELGKTPNAVQPAPAKLSAANSELPSFNTGDGYAQIRKQLLADGWKPFHAAEADTCSAGDTRCEGRPEMQACTGTGLGNCKFLWKKGSTLIGINTIGDGDPSFASLDQEKLPAASTPEPIKTKAETPSQSESTKSSKGGEWYISMAKPALTVRNQPDVTGEKIGMVPPEGKVKVIEKNIKADSISGRSGSWVKIEWQNTSAYVFDVFLEKMH